VVRRGALSLIVMLALAFSTGSGVARAAPGDRLAPAAGGGRLGDAARFHTWTGYEVGKYPQAVAAADFDGDGSVDVAFAHLSFVHNTIGVQLNLGDGTMGPVVGYPAANQTNDLVAADLNGDGSPDLVAASEGLDEHGHVIDVYLNRGDGTFRHQMVTGGDGPSRLTVADVNGDGHPDLVVANNSYIDQGTTVGVLMGVGNGTFGAETRYTVGLGVFGIAAADLDGDGRIDLVAGRATRDEVAYHVDFLKNRGAGKFRLVRDVTVPGTEGYVPIQPVVAAADFNGDGHVDVVSGAGVADELTIFRNTGHFMFATSTIPGAFGVQNLLAGDLNGDGRADVAEASPFGGTQSTGELDVLWGAGSGALDAPVFINQGAQPTDIAAADFNGDGLLDLAVANEQSGTGSIQPQLHPGQFAGAPVYQAADGLLPLDSASADFNGDGRIDMALDELDLFSEGRDRVAIMMNRGKGRMELTATLLSGTDSHPKAVIAADLNGDGHPDLAWTPEIAGDPVYPFAVALNKGNGSFGPTRLYPLQTCGTGHVSAIDVNADDALDLVVGNNRGGPGCEQVSSTVRIALNNGDGTFQPDYGVELGSLSDMAVGADFNGDGIMDLAVTDAISYVVFGTGGGEFGPATAYRSRGNEVAVGDFNGDGHPDIATTDGSLQSMWVMLNRGTGTFRLIEYPGEQIGGYLTGNAIAVDDVDGDGRLDIAVSDYQGQDVGVFYGLSKGAFRQEIRYGVQYDLSDVTLADYDGDGHPDIGGPAGTGGLFGFGLTGVTTLLNRTR
jgi:hypothetical protein